MNWESHLLYVFEYREWKPQIWILLCIHHLIVAIYEFIWYILSTYNMNYESNFYVITLKDSIRMTFFFLVDPFWLTRKTIKTMCSLFRNSTLESLTLWTNKKNAKSRLGCQFYSSYFEYTIVFGCSYAFPNHVFLQEIKSSLIT